MQENSKNQGNTNTNVWHYDLLNIIQINIYLIERVNIIFCDSYKKVLFLWKYEVFISNAIFFYSIIYLARFKSCRSNHDGLKVIPSQYNSMKNQNLNMR